jgi:hypothetical protein
MQTGRISVDDAGSYATRGRLAADDEVFDSQEF